MKSLGNAIQTIEIGTSLGNAIETIEMGTANASKRDRSVDADRQAKAQAILLVCSLGDKEPTPERAMAYQIAVEQETPETVLRAAKNFIRGEVPDHDNRFGVKPPQLARECRRIAAPREAFERVWKQPDPTQVALESPDVQRDRDLLLVNGKSPKERLEIINRIRAKVGMEPFDPVRFALQKGKIDPRQIPAGSE